VERVDVATVVIASSGIRFDQSVQVDRHPSGVSPGGPE
jgi:hypothetical protein